MIALVISSLMVAMAVLLLPSRPWSTRESLDAGETGMVELSDVTALVPARNEAAVIERTLAGLAQQGNNLRIIVIDDESSDGTAVIASASGTPHLEVIAGSPLPAGWSGKLWALEQGRARVDTPLTLLLDADIVLLPGVLPALLARRAAHGLQLVSLMAHLGMAGFWERLLMPAFVYFFKMIYPFQLANDPRSRVAAAAGGCILIETAALDAMGGFAAIRHAVIDDCTLAGAVKRGGGKTWLGLTHSACSQRRYSLHEIWNMVARTAYTQLRYSPLLLGACTLLLIVYYLIPPALLVFGSGTGAQLAGVAGALLLIPYLPVLWYYRLSSIWALLLPLTAALFLAMTWTSALRFHRGERSRWKERSYQRSH